MCAGVTHRFLQKRVMALPGFREAIALRIYKLFVLFVFLMTLNECQLRRFEIAGEGAAGNFLNSAFFIS